MWSPSAQTREHFDMQTIVSRVALAPANPSSYTITINYTAPYYTIITKWIGPEQFSIRSYSICRCENMCKREYLINIDRQGTYMTR